MASFPHRGVTVMNVFCFSSLRAAFVCKMRAYVSQLCGSLLNVHSCVSVALGVLLQSSAGSIYSTTWWCIYLLVIARRLKQHRSMRHLGVNIALAQCSNQGSNRKSERQCRGIFLPFNFASKGILWIQHMFQLNLLVKCLSSVWQNRHS